MHTPDPCKDPHLRVRTYEEPEYVRIPLCCPGSEPRFLMYTSGTVAQIPDSIMGSGRTLALHMYVLSSEGLYMDQAYATAVILLVLVVGINALSSFIARKLTKA